MPYSMKTLYFALALIFCTSSLFAHDEKGSFMIKNNGQWESDFDYKTNINGGAIFFTSNSVVYNLYDEHQVEEIHHDSHDDDNARNQMVNFHAFEIKFLNAKTEKLEGENKRAYYQNYYIGNDPQKWKSKVPTFDNVRYQEIYDGIDLVYFTADNHLKYEYYVAPNANAAKIQMQLKGATASLNNNGELVIKTSLGDKKELKPFSYQMINGERKIVKTEFAIDKNIVSFNFPDGYDKNAELVIDPVLIFATYSGGTSMTFGWSAAYDQTGHLYSGGECFGVGWPVTVGSFQQMFAGSIDVGINRYTITGTGLVHSTYLGGSSADLPCSMVCTSNDELIVAGYTGSGNFPTTAGCYDNTANGGNDLFITSFDVNGVALLGSTYIGGSGSEGSSTHEVNVDASNNIYVASVTQSSNFPTTAGAFQTAISGSSSGIVLKMDLNCTSLLASTYLGGSGSDMCEGVLIASNGDILTTGTTSSLNFPTTAGAYQTSIQGGVQDAFVCKFDNSLSNQLAGTYLGTSDDDNGYRVQMDMSNNIYVCGTSDGNNYPVSPGVYSNANGRVFIDKLDPNLTTSLLSTKIGATTGFSFLRPTAFLLDICENVYVSCQGASANLPITADAYQSTQGGLWVTVLTPNYGSQLYGSFIGSSGDHIDGGGSRFDPQGIIYQSICTSSPNTYSSIGAHSPTNQASSWDIASMKLEFGYSSVTANFTKDKADTVCVNEVISFMSASSSATVFGWDFGDGNTSNLQNPTHSYSNPGLYTIRLIAENNAASCSSIDTVTKTILVAEVIVPQITAYNDTLCDKEQTTLNLDVLNDNGNFKFTWTPAMAVVSGGNTKSPLIDPTLATTFNVKVLHEQYPGYCADSSSATINILLGDTTQMAVSPEDSTICYGSSVNLVAVGGATYSWTPTIAIDDPLLPTINVTPFSNKDYDVEITDLVGCSATKHVSIQVERAQANAGRDKFVKYGGSISLDGSRSIGSKFLWDADPDLLNETSLTPLVSPTETKTFYLNAITDFGCTDRDSVVVKITNAVIPNAFSPNGDNLNDVFRIIWATPDVKIETFRIFNRWGQNIFSTKNIYDGWDGTYKGEPCDLGTYYYIIVLSIDEKGYTYKGDINLIR